MNQAALAAGAAVIMAGCSFAPLIKSDSADFGATLDEVSNDLLITNILRARDHAPLHFADLSALRAQFQLTGSVQTVFPFGAFSRTDPFSSKVTAGVGSAATRASNADILSIQTAPSFDFSPLDTQEFTRGILSPLDPQVVKYYFDRNMPQEMLLFLFVDRVSPVIPTFAPTGGAPDNSDYVNDPEHPEKFKKFADWVEGVFGAYRDARVIVANSYYRQVGPPIEGDTEKPKPLGNEPGGGAQNRNTGSAGTSQTRVECFDTGQLKIAGTAPAAQTNVGEAKGTPAKAEEPHCNENTKRYKLVTYSEPPEIILCATENFFVPLALVTADMSDPKVAKKYEEKSAATLNLWKQLCTSRFAPATTSREVGTIYIRSVETIIQYLGQLIDGPNRQKNQEILQHALGYTLFDLNTEPSGARFGVSYRGETYYVQSYDAEKDRTTLTLAFVNQLLNLNKKATEIPTTRAVEIVP